MIQVFADGELTYDSRIEEYDLQGLKVTRGLNKGGTAEIVMPPYHPAYSSYTGYKTIVEIYRDRRMKFRGRALYHTDDFDNQRTVVCEGELCFLQDAIVRPYLYQTDPKSIFVDLITTYNNQVEPFKQFKIDADSIDVIDPNEYIRLESESAETVLAAVNKLLERCGGYIIFFTDAFGDRCISWRTSVGRKSGQTIEVGENLFSFSRSEANTDIATALLPYGAKDEATGERVTIESVNDGKDYIVDEAAVALRGTIMKTVTFDDVTEPSNLLTKARQYLDERKVVITSLHLTALDLSYVDKTIDSFEEGDKIRVVSKAHVLDEDFQLVDIAENLLNPTADGFINLGKDAQSLTSQDVAGDNKSLSALQKVTSQITSDYTLNNTQAIQETEKMLTSLIEQTSEAIKQEVAQTFVTNDQLTEAVSSRMSQFEDQFLFEFETLKATVDKNDADALAQLTEIYKYISFDNGDIKLGASDSAITLTLENDKIVFKKNGAQFGWWDGVDFHTGNIVVEVNERAQFGNFAFVPRSNGSLSFLKIGG